MHFDVEFAGLEKFAASFWEAAGSVKVFAFHGQMGAGKTTTIAALCRKKGVKDAIGSPTFSIINEYAADGNERIFHIDLYRLKDDEEILQAGVADCIDSGDLCFVEWPEKAPWLFEQDAMHVFIRALDNGRREIIMRHGNANGGSVSEQS